MDWEFRYSIAYNIAYGLRYLHIQDPPIFYRGLNMSNVFLRWNGRAFLSDLGMATESIATAGFPFGSPHWSAPEILNGDPYTEFADVYSFGLILYSLATGQDAYTGHLDDVSKKVKKGIRPRIPQNDIPKEFEELMRQCWEQQPERRPNMKEVCLRLDAMCKGFKLPRLLQDYKEFKYETKSGHNLEMNDNDSSAESPNNLKIQSSRYVKPNLDSVTVS